MYITIIGSLLFSIICLLLSIAYYTLTERKVMAAIQRRRGPNIVGFWGLLQPLADGLKAVTKEIIIPRGANYILFMMAPILMFSLSLFNWIFIPFNFSDLLLHSIKDSLILDSFNYNIVHYFLLNIEIFASYWTNFFDKDTNYIINITYPLILFYRDIKFNLQNSHISLLFIFAISSLNVYGVILAGWASNSKYAFLGALRSASQMISYEVALGLLIIPVILLTNSLNLADIVKAQHTIWLIFPLLPDAPLFFISCLAETNRTPFDLPEAEAELVAGYNVEFSSIPFAMFFLGEYSNMLVMSALLSILFLAGWLIPFANYGSPLIFSIKIILIAFLFVLVRAMLPRYRYDQLLNLGWRLMLPLALAITIATATITLFFHN